MPRLGGGKPISKTHESAAANIAPEIIAVSEGAD